MTLDLIRTARRTNKQTQKALSARSGVPASSLSLIEQGKRNPTLETVDSLLRSTGHTLVTVRTMRESAATIASRVERALGDSRPDLAVRHFLQLNDNLIAEHNEVRYVLGSSEPAATGVKHWDAALAALVAYRLAEEDFPAPSWTLHPDRYLKKRWTFNDGLYVIPVDTVDVPTEFLERGVLIDAATLVSV